MEVVRKRMNGKSESESYPPRFVHGDIVICLHDGGIDHRIKNGTLYKVGYEGNNNISSVYEGSRWQSKTKIYVSTMQGERINGVMPWNYRFDLAEGMDEPSCSICESACKSDKVCDFFISIIKEEPA